MAPPSLRAGSSAWKVASSFERRQGHCIICGISITSFGDMAMADGSRINPRCIRRIRALPSLSRSRLVPYTVSELPTPMLQAHHEVGANFVRRTGISFFASWNYCCTKVPRSDDVSTGGLYCMNPETEYRCGLSRVTLRGGPQPQLSQEGQEAWCRRKLLQ
jgi:hypothetical protein